VADIELQGRIEKVLFTNADNGYAVVQLQCENAAEPQDITAVGTILSPKVGETLIMHGTWIEHQRFGRQFQIQRHETVMPTSAEGLERYLGSGLIKGLGPDLAGRIIKKFGTETIEILDSDPDQLLKVHGIGKNKLAGIKDSWSQQHGIRNLMLFLQEHDIGPGVAARIYRRFGANSLAAVRDNPYCLATEVSGIGFVTADQVAMKLGFKPSSPLRMEAGLLYVLQEFSSDGHVYAPRDILLQRAKDILDSETSAITSAIDTLALRGEIVIEPIGVRFADSDSSDCVYPAILHNCEQQIAKRLCELQNATPAHHHKNIASLLCAVERKLSFKLSAQQAEAVRRVFETRVQIITGGPGTGKTTIVQAVLQLALKEHLSVMLAAPTGRAAKRMAEATGREAKTLHRLLKYDFQSGTFEQHAGNPLDCGMLIIDEASMIDTYLMYQVLCALKPGCALVLVGDMHQLPSVGPGNILSDIINSAVVPVAELTEIFRQARQSRIIMNAHRINNGNALLDVGDADKLTDFYFIEKDDPASALKTVLEVTAERVPARFKLDPMQDVQIITPMHKGLIGTENLNRELQQVLNPGHILLERGNRSFRAGDKVMQVRNNYDLDVFNGDIGMIMSASAEKKTAVVMFDDRAVCYSFNDLDDLVPAYAISVHKSQGSEFPAVVMPLLTQHYIMLQRNLLYTAITRGKKLVVIVGSRKALAMSVANDKPRLRYSGLCERLRKFSQQRKEL
jgi:exodeoxyribonuclease V alpha subunit